MGFWDGLRRFFCGWEKARDLEHLCSMVKNADELIDYAKQHFIYKERKLDVVNWLPPEQAFIALHVPDDTRVKDSVNCDDCSSVEWYVLGRIGYDARLIYVANDKTAHAIVLYEVKGKYRYCDSHYHPQWDFNSVQEILRDVYSHPTRAYFMRWDGKKFVKGEDIAI